MNKGLLLVLIAFLIFSKNQAQAGETETKFWSSINYTNWVNKRWNVGVEQHFRLKDNLNAVDNFISELNTNYKLGNKWKLQGELRYIFDRDNKGEVQGYDPFIRYRFGVQKGFKLKRTLLKLRAAYQIKKEINKGNEERLLRFRPTLEIPIRNWKWDPNFFIAYFHPLTENVDRSFRYGVSTERKIRTNAKLLFKYFLVRTEKENNTAYSQVFSIRYGFSNKKK